MLTTAAKPRLTGYRFIICLLGLALGLGGCASLPDNSGRQFSYALTDTDDTEFGKSLAEAKQIHGEKDGFLLLANGLDAFVARAAMARTAERSIDVQYYLFHDDTVGGLLLAELIEAANRGVRVRILIDDMDLKGRDDGMVAIDRHPNIELRVFNPFGRNIGRGVQFVTGFGTLTRRMHNKSFTVDNQMAVVGGRNIGNEYFAADPALEFADLDVLVIGDVVPEISESFDLYWNSALAYPVSLLNDNQPSDEEVEAVYRRLAENVEAYQDSPYMQALADSELAKQLGSKSLVFEWGNVDVFYDLPDKIENPRDQTELHLMPQLEPYFEAIENELVIFSPYFVPGKEGVEFFGKLIANGARVKILTNSLASNDVGAVHAGYSKYRKDLLRAGVELYEMNKRLPREDRSGSGTVGSSGKASLHAKSFVLDRNKIFVGSLNLDPRSFYENSEIGVIIESDKIASAMVDSFDRDIDKIAFRVELVTTDSGGEQLLWHGFENGKAVTFDNEPYSTFWQRFGVGFMRLLPIESQL